MRAVIPHADPNLVYDIKYYSEYFMAVHTTCKELVTHFVFLLIKDESMFVAATPAPCLTVQNSACSERSPPEAAGRGWHEPNGDCVHET